MAWELPYEPHLLANINIIPQAANNRYPELWGVNALIFCCRNQILNNLPIFFNWGWVSNSILMKV